jgi:tripartite-type tricarboxylate transporter receptor subunit TctC
MKWMKILAGAALLAFGAPAHAVYPERAVRVIVPFPPGGTTDLIARTVAGHMSNTLGQPFVVDNRAGAGTVIGVEAASKAPADGYNLLLSVATSFAINPHVLKKLPYKIDEFVPIGFIGEVPVMFVSSASAAQPTLAALIETFKKEQKAGREVLVATTGKGAFVHLTAAIFFNTINVPFKDVPYRGEAPAIVALLGGEVSYYFGSMVATLPQVNAGKLKGYAVTSATRSPAAPSVPSFTELGHPKVLANSWFGFSAPKGTPREAVNVLSGAINKALDDKAIQEKLAAEGAITRRMTPEEFAAYIKNDYEHWGRSLKAAGVEAVD